MVGLYRCVGCMDAPLKNVFTISLGITYTNCHFQGIEQTLVCVRFSKHVSFKFIPP